MSSPQRNPDSWIIAIFLAWLVPGLGHWYLGRRGKATVFFVCIAGLFLTGLYLGQWRPVNYDDTILFIGQCCAGVLSFVSGYIGRYLVTQHPIADWPVPVAAEMAVLFTLVASLLNLLVVFDSFMVANNIERPTRQSRAGGQA
jgi:hypothetical protein